MSQLVCEECGKQSDVQDTLIVELTCIHVRCLEWRWFGPNGLFVSFQELLTDLDAFVSTLPTWVATHLSWSPRELYAFSQLLVHHPDLEYPVETLIWAWLLEVHHLVSTDQVTHSVPFQLYNRCVWQVLLDLNVDNENTEFSCSDLFDTLQQQMSDMAEGVVLDHVIFYVHTRWSGLHESFDRLETQCPHWNQMIEQSREETMRYLIRVCVMAVHDDLHSLDRHWENDDHIHAANSIFERVMEWTTLMQLVPASSIHMMHAFHETFWSRMISRWSFWFDNYLHVHTSTLSLFRGVIHRLNEFVGAWKLANDEKKEDLKKHVEGFFLHVEKPVEVFPTSS
jgi:hypothetical protein